MSDALLQAIKANNPDLIYARSDERGYALIEFSPKQCLTEFRGTSHPAGSADTLKVQARFAVTPGQAGPHPA